MNRLFIRRAVLFILIATILSCGDGTKKVDIYNEDGSLNQTYRIDIDSLRQGELITYYSNGKDIFEKAMYLNDRLHGSRTLYYENGQKEIEEYYAGDVLTDSVYVYYESGSLKVASYYELGVLTGVSSVYNEDGGIKEEVHFENNIEQGPFKEFHSNGQVQWEGNYLNGDNEFGELKEYNEEGTLIKKMICDSLAVCSTIWTIEKGDIAPAYVRKTSQ